MNPLTNMKNVTKLSERELQNNSKSSWHDQYRDSAWIFIGGLPYDLTEGDIICIFSQYGEVVNINLIRDKDSGKSKGFCFLCYEDQRSTVLAVDNLNGVKVLNRILRVDHVSEYKIPKEGKKTDEETKKLYNEGCAPKPIVPIKRNPIVEDLEYRRETLADQIQADIKLPARLPIHVIKKETVVEEPLKVKTEEATKKNKKEKSWKYSVSEDEDATTTGDKVKQKKKKQSKKQRSISESDSESEKETYKKQKSHTQSFDNFNKYRSKNKEENIKPRDQSRSTERNMKWRCRSQSFDKKDKEKSRSRSLERKSKRSRSREYDYEEHRRNTKRNRSRECNESRSSRKHSNSRRYDKHRRRSRS